MYAKLLKLNSSHCSLNMKAPLHYIFYGFYALSHVASFSLRASLSLPVCLFFPLCDIQAYRMQSSPRGLALVLSNVTFNPSVSDFETRRGGEVDEEVLSKLFEELDFRVDIRKDLTAQVQSYLI